MRKFLLFTLIVSLPSLVFGQYKKEIGIILGGSSYLGEMGGKSKTRRDFVLDTKLAQTRTNEGIYFRYKVKPKIFVTGTFNHGAIRGADTLSTNPARNGRRLNFKNNIFELGVLGEYVFYQNNGMKGRGGSSRGGSRRGGSKKDFRAYVTGGLAWYRHNPKGTDMNGDWVKLQPLGTEGQGTTGKAAKYKLSGFAIPLGAGFNYTLNRTYRIGVELGWRTTFTDYLDDVSTVYVNPERFEKPAGDNTSDLYKQKFYFYDKSDKRPDDDPNRSEIAANGRNYGYDAERAAKFGEEAGEQKRGDAKHKDSYMFLQVKLGYVLKGKSKYYRSKSSYISRSKYKKRRVRAKF
jgi:hypothetical protein